MGKAVLGVGGEADEVEELGDAVGESVDETRFVEEVFDGHAGIERSEGVLEDHLDLVAAGVDEGLVLKEDLPVAWLFKADEHPSEG